MKNCNKCGAQLIDEAVFCTNCGASLEDNLEETGLPYDDDEMNTTVLDEDIEEISPFVEEVNQFAYEEPIKEPDQGTVPPQYVNPMYQDTNNIHQQIQQVNQLNQQNQYVQPVPVSQENTYGQNWNPAQPIVEQPTLKSCYKKFWNNYANFNGRSRRSEYWFVVVMNLIIALVNVIPYVGQGLYGLYALAIIVPTLALIVRRLHDLGKEWYYIFFLLIPIAGQIIMLVWLCTDSQVGANKFGENPKGIN